LRFRYRSDIKISVVRRRKAQVGFASEEATAALFARIPASSAAKLDRASFELKRPKREIVAQLVDRYAGELALHDEEWTFGRHSFEPAVEPEVLTLEQVATLLQVEPGEVQKLAARRELPGRQIGDEWRFSRRAVLRWLEVTE
jgi:excisionase family DNA binding protein